MSIKLIVAGSRSLDSIDEQYLEEDGRRVVARAIVGLCSFERRDVSAVLSGTASGPDEWGEAWAGALSSVNCHLRPADWDQHGRAAGPIRNKEMAQEADALLAFFDGESAGTQNMINEARKAGLDVTIAWMNEASKMRALLGQ